MTNSSKKPNSKSSNSVELSCSKVEKNLDKLIDNLSNKKIAKDFTKSKLVKDILSSKVVCDLNKKLKSYIPTIFDIMGWICLIGGIVQILLSLEVFVFAFNFFRLSTIIAILIGIFVAIFTAIMGFGIIRKKTRVPFMSVVVFVSSSFIFLLNIFLYSSRLLSGLIYVLLSFIFTVLVLKNTEIFKKEKIETDKKTS